MFTADALLNAISQAVLATDGDGTIVVSNPAADRLFGGGTSLIGRTLAGVMTGHDVSELFAAVREKGTWSGGRRSGKVDGHDLVSEPLAVCTVVASRALSSIAHQSRLAQHAKVLRHGGLPDASYLRQLSDRVRSLSHPLEERSARWIGERSECQFIGHDLYRYMATNKSRNF